MGSIRLILDKLALKEKEREQKRAMEALASQARRVSMAPFVSQSMSGVQKAKPKQVARRKSWLKSGSWQKKIKTSEYVGYLIDNICALDFIYDVNFDAGKDESGI